MMVNSFLWNYVQRPHLPHGPYNTFLSGFRTRVVNVKNNRFICGSTKASSAG